MAKPLQVMRMKQMGQMPPGMPMDMMAGMPAQATGNGPKKAKGPKKAAGPKKKAGRKK